MKAIIENDTPLEAKCRKETICRGCGSQKDTGLVVCWDCFKYVRVPFKEFDGTLEEWLKKYAKHHD